MKYTKSLIAAGCLLASIGMANAQSLGFVTLSASVSAKGATAFGSGISSSSRIGTGVYSVTFTRDVTQCTILVGPRSSAGGQASASGAISSTVRVYTFSKTGVAANSAFSLLAICNS